MINAASSVKCQQHPTLKELSDALKYLVSWKEVAIQLGFHESSILKISKLPFDDQKLQMIMELLQRDADLSWEKVARALHHSKHETLAEEVRAKYIRGKVCQEVIAEDYMDYEDTDAAVLQHNMDEIHGRFTNLIMNVQNALEERAINVSDVRKFLVRFFRNEECIPKGSLDEIFNAVTLNNLWNYQKYSPVEKLVQQFIPEKESIVKTYKGDFTGFCLAVKLLRYIKYGNIPIIEEGDNPSPPKLSLEHYKRLKVELKLKTKISELSLTYVHELWISIAEVHDLPSLTAVLQSLGIGSLEIVWLILPHESEKIAASAHKSISFFHRNSIVHISIDGCPVYHEMDGKSPLVRAAEWGNEMAVLKLLDDGADVNRKQEYSGKTALFFAAENGHLTTTTILLAYGASADRTDSAGENVYSVAKKKGHTEVCKELQEFESGRVPQVRTISTQQRITETLESIRDAVFGKFYQAYRWMTSDIIGATRSGDVQAVMYMLEHSKDVKALIQCRESGKHGWTALMYACDGGSYRIVELLLDKEADPNDAAKSNGWSSLMLASRREQLRIMKALLDRGADPNLQNNIGISALPIALYEKRTAAALLLIHRGADVNLSDNNGWTPLMRASNEGNLKLVKVISDLGADLNAQTKEGWSSLMIASCYGYTDVVKELTYRGAELDLKTSAGDTALHIATIRNKCEVLEALVGLEVDLDATNKDGLTALMVATNKNYEEIVDALVRGGANVNHPHAATKWTAIFFAGKNTSVEIVQKLLRQGAHYTLSDGTSLTNVVSHLKDNIMQTVSDLGVSVPSTSTSLEESNVKSQDVSYTARSLSELVYALEERFSGLVKMAI